MNPSATQADLDTLRINGERLWDALMELAQLGAMPKGGKFDGNYGALAGIEVVRTLNDYSITIGVVQGVLGIRWLACTVTGMQAHAGPTPMALRKDGLVDEMAGGVKACAARLSAKTGCDARAGWGLWRHHFYR